MVLSDEGILKEMSHGRITISNFEKRRLQANSYDVLLGNWFYDVHWDKDGPYFVGPLWLADGHRCYVSPGTRRLAMTKDVIGTFYDIFGLMKNKSSNERVDIDPCGSAGWGDVGYNNHWTLELRTTTTGGLPFLIVGQPVAQIAFMRCETPPSETYRGQYVADDWPECMIPKKCRDRIIAIDSGYAPQENPSREEIGVMGAGYAPLYKGGKI